MGQVKYLIFKEKAGAQKVPVEICDYENEAETRCGEYDNCDQDGFYYFWMPVPYQVGVEVCEHDDWSSMLGPNDERLKKCNDCGELMYR